MKNLILVSLLLSLLACSSCSKDWLCKCGGTTGTEYFAIPNQTKADAIKICEEYEYYYTTCSIQ